MISYDIGVFLLRKLANVAFDAGVDIENSGETYDF